MGLIEAVEDWVFHKELGIVVAKVATAAASYAAAHAGLTSSWGVSVSINPDLASAAVLGGVHLAASWASSKYPRAFGWAKVL